MYFSAAPRADGEARRTAHTQTGREKMANASERQSVVRAACPHDCPDTCAMLVTVEDGRAVAVRGDPEHPFTRGGLCVKVNNYEQRVYSPDRENREPRSKRMPPWVAPVARTLILVRMSLSLR